MTLRQRIARGIRALESRHRLNVGLRLLLAALGGYALALIGAAALARVDFGFRPDSVSFALMMGFLIYLIGIIWSFGAKSLSRAVMGVVVPTLLFAIWASPFTRQFPAASERQHADPEKPHAAAHGEAVPRQRIAHVTGAPQ